MVRTTLDDIKSSKYFGKPCVSFLQIVEKQLSYLPKGIITKLTLFFNLACEVPLAVYAISRAAWS